MGLWTIMNTHDRNGENDKMTSREYLVNECWGLIVWPLGALLAFYNGALLAAFVCTLFTGIAIGLACRDIHNIKED